MLLSVAGVFLPRITILENMYLLLPIAFISGVLTVFSPCVLPILPIVLSSGIDGNVKRIRGMVVGLIVSFTLASLLLTTVITFLHISVDIIRFGAVVLLVLLGISMVFPKLYEKVQFFIERHWKVRPIKKQGNGFESGFITGVSLGIIWTPCVGPIVATVATLAATNSFSLITVFIAFSYALGTGLPLYAIARGGSSVTKRLTLFKTHNKQIRQVFGGIILATALFIYFGADRAVQSFTLNVLPSSWTQLGANFENSLHINSTLKQLKNAQNIKKPHKGDTVIQQVSLQNDFTDSKVNPSDIEQGCFGQDCIPAITHPKFDKADEANWLNDSDTVFAINYKGVLRAYPQRILNWHEIVNDTVLGDPLAITFCPLCGTAVAYKRVVNGIITEFGVSGKLYNSDLIMYDRYEGNLWQQATGQAIVGPAARRNETLQVIDIDTTSWRQWKRQHPDTFVLSRDSGYTRNYNQYPYGTYEQDDQVYFGVKSLNRKLQIKTVVYGVEVSGAAKAYPKSVIDNMSVIQDSIGGVPIKIQEGQAGEVAVTNMQTNQQIIPLRVFWFAWAAFHPNTELYQ